LTFFDDYPKKLASLEEAIKAKNIADIQKIAHSLKGSISNFGKKQAFDSANKINLKAKKSDIENIEQDYNDLLQELDKLVTALKAEIT
jgi:HPt (histidine-containing phosphotransfer) domain-containing protein